MSSLLNRPLVFSWSGQLIVTTAYVRPHSCRYQEPDTYHHTGLASPQASHIVCIQSLSPPPDLVADNHNTVTPCSQMASIVSTLSRQSVRQPYSTRQSLSPVECSAELTRSPQPYSPNHTHSSPPPPPPNPPSQSAHAPAQSSSQGPKSS
jgi:hypothetical protein